MKQVSQLRLENVGPIRCANVTLGDLTVLVGPQATGKSIFLQFLKLVLDTGYIHDQLRKHGIEWHRQPADFLDVYLGEGMCGVWGGDSVLCLEKEPVHAADWFSPRRRSTASKLFYIPAQRVLSLANGWPRPFQSFATEDPFVVRDFSETFRRLMEQEFGRATDVFPKTNRLKKEYRDLLAEHVFGRFRLLVDRHGAQKRLVLQRNATRPGSEHVEPKTTGATEAIPSDEKPVMRTTGGESGASIPFMTWSAGQREFVPLLMGLYWLMPASKTNRRKPFEWVVIEEPEMGLHPQAIAVVLLLVLELLWRGYRVCLSTHSPHVLDLVWAMRRIQQYQAKPNYLLDLFRVRKSQPMKQVAEEVVKKRLCVHFFDRKGMARDISNLDPGSRDKQEADWGGLTEFSGRALDVVAQVVNATETAAEVQ